MLRHGVRLPPALVDRNTPVYDTMREWSRFTLDDRQYIGLGELLALLGVEHHKTVVSGPMVPELYQQGRWPEILAYAAADVLAVWQIFLRMTGQTECPMAPQSSQTLAPQSEASDSVDAKQESIALVDLDQIMQQLGLK